MCRKDNRSTSLHKLISSVHVRLLESVLIASVVPANKVTYRQIMHHVSSYKILFQCCKKSPRGILKHFINTI